MDELDFTNQPRTRAHTRATMPTVWPLILLAFLADIGGTFGVSYVAGYRIVDARTAKLGEAMTGFLMGGETVAERKEREAKGGKR